MTSRPTLHPAFVQLALQRIVKAPWHDQVAFAQFVLRDDRISRHALIFTLEHLSTGLQEHFPELEEDHSEKLKGYAEQWLPELRS